MQQQYRTGCWKPESELMSNRGCVVELCQFEEVYANVNLQEATVTLQEATSNYIQHIGSNSQIRTSTSKYYFVTLNTNLNLLKPL